MSESGPGSVEATSLEGRLLVAVGVHLLASAGHGIVHGLVPVPVPWGLLAVTVGALFLLPLVGCCLLVDGRTRTGAWLVLAGTLSGAVVEVVAHFVVVNPDHVSRTAHVAFGPTALASTVGSVLAAASAVWYVASQRHGGAVNSAIDLKM